MKENRYITLTSLRAEARTLIADTQGGKDNPEYARALVELVGYSSGVLSENFPKVAKQLGITSYGRESLSRKVPALTAIKARIDGDWDNPDLLHYGPLTTDTNADIKRIIADTQQD